MKCPAILSLSIVSSFAAPVWAQCPAVDPGFASPGADGVVEDLLEFDDGSGVALYAAGRFGAVGTAVANGVARWNGVTWAPVGTGLTEFVRDLAVLDLGSGPQLFAAGFSTSGSQGTGFVARWDGSAWQPVGGSIASSQAASTRIETIAAYAEGGVPKLFVGGQKYTFNDDAIPFVMRFDGTNWADVPNGPHTSFHPFFGDPWLRTGSIQALLTHDDGSGPKLYASGQFDLVGPSVGFGIARWDGTSWGAVGGTGLGSADTGVGSLVTYDDGSGSALFLAYNNSTSPAMRWNGTSFTPVGTLALGTARQFLASGPVLGRPAGLWATGAFSVGGVYRRLAFWDGSTWNVENTPALSGYQYFDPLATLDTGNGRELFLGGDFLVTSPVRTQNVARFDGAAYADVGSASSTETIAYPSNSNSTFVEALAIHDAGNGRELFASGNFTAAGDSLARDIARFDGSRWQALSGSTSLSNQYHDLVSFQDELWVAGELYPGSIGLVPFMRWTGTAFFTIPSSAQGTQGRGFVLLDTPGGPVLYAIAERSVMRWNGATLLEITHVNAGNLGAIQAFDDGTGPAVYVTGAFTSIGGVTAKGIARFDGTTWSALGAGLDGTVHALAIHDDGHGARLYAGGQIPSSGATPLSNVAQWTGSTWTSVGGGVTGASVDVTSLVSCDDGRGQGAVLFAGGSFETAGGVPARNLARWDGTAWSEALGGARGPSGKVRALLAADLASLSGRFLYAAGDFSGIGDVPSARFARIATCDEVGATFCYGDGSEAACPCANESPVGARAGCTNSLGLAGEVRAHGRSSLGDDTLRIDGAGMPNSAALYFQAANRHVAFAFGDGLKCTGGPFVRMGTKFNVNGASSYPEVGDLSASVRGFVLAPGTRHYQVRYRNSASFCTIDTFNYTSAVTIVWTP